MGRRILVTGGAGFLGTSLQAELSSRGHVDVVAPTSQEFDMTDPLAIRRMLEQTEPACVIHLAATVGGIGANRKHPGLFFYRNAVMGIHLMEEARLAGVDKVVLVGTVCSYPKFTPIPFKEQDIWNGYPEETNAPYGIAKKALLVQSQAYRQEYGFNSIYLIPVNLYGPRDDFDPENSHVIPALIRKFVEARESGAPSVTAWGTGSASREFLYVDDAAHAIVLATESYNGVEPVNIGASIEITIRDLVEIIQKLTGYEGSVQWDTSMPDGQPRRKINTTRAEAEFGFRSTTDFETGLKQTISWYEQNRKNGA